ncbi:MAG: NAD-dependent epimerase/dehydratase family protein [Bacteroidales bacterium]|nr:NAD-dependent epimerase/dehydratase family protein [Bacteroidales bacterium]MCF8405281.1 NAD-dependent epimerase/dehydratase family protein [Bacteroidales bacterium]
MQTILGSGGAIGIPLAKELTKYTKDIRLVSRNPKKVNESDELFPLDVNNLNQIEKAIEGSEVVYVTIGFEYNIKAWRSTWPPFMQAVIDACKKHQAKLVFLDNVYMYSKEAIPYMTEEAPLQPPSKKGEVRLQLHHMIMNEVEKNNLTALIARSADFYGPDNKNSVLTITVADNLLKGKKAQVMGNSNKIHTYTYTPDAAVATALLGNTSDAWNQVWHLPTTKEKLTGMDWIHLIAEELKVKAKIQTVPAWMIRLLGLFIPIMNELYEMQYQNQMDYIFDSSKFEKRFGIAATSPKEGVHLMMESLKNS